MKCPYSVDTEQVNQHRYEYNDDSLCVFSEHKLIEHSEFNECFRDECAAFIDGKCTYKG